MSLVATAEVLGAAIACTVLWWLVLKRVPIWLAVLLHFGVAVTPDVPADIGNGLRIGLR